MAPPIRCACLVRQLDTCAADGESALEVTDEGIALLESLGPGPVVVIAVRMAGQPAELSWSCLVLV